VEMKIQFGHSGGYILDFLEPIDEH